MPSRLAARSVPKQTLAVGKKAINAVFRREAPTGSESRANLAESGKRRRKSSDEVGKVVEEVITEAPEARAENEEVYRIGERVECCDTDAPWTEWKNGTVTCLSPLMVRRDGVADALVWSKVRRKQASIPEVGTNDQLSSCKDVRGRRSPSSKSTKKNRARERSQSKRKKRKSQNKSGNTQQRNSKLECLDQEDASAGMNTSPISVAESSPPKSEGDIDPDSSAQTVLDSSVTTKNGKLSDDASCGTPGANTPSPARQRDSTSPVKATAMQHRGKTHAAKTCGKAASAHPLHAAFARASSTRQRPSVDEHKEEIGDDDNSPAQPKKKKKKKTMAKSAGKEVESNLLKVFDDVMEPDDALDDDSMKFQSISNEQQADCESQNIGEQMLDDTPETKKWASASQKTSLQLKGCISNKRIFGKTSDGQPSRRGTMLAFAKPGGNKPLVFRSCHQTSASSEEVQNEGNHRVAEDADSPANEKNISEPGAKSCASHKQDCKQRKPTKLSFGSLKKNDAHIRDLQETLPEKRRAVSHEEEPSGARQCLTDNKERSASSEKRTYSMKRLMTLFQNNKKMTCSKEGGSPLAAASPDEVDENRARHADTSEPKDSETVTIEVDVEEACADPSKKGGKALPPGIDSLPPGVRWIKKDHLIEAQRKSDKKKLSLSLRKMTIQSAIKLATEYIVTDNAALAEAERLARPKLWTDRHRPQSLKWIKCPCWEVLGRWLRSWSSGPPANRAALVCGAVGVGKSIGARLAIERSRINGEKPGERRLLEYDLKDKEGKTFIENLCKGQTTYASGSLANTVVLLEIDGACRNFLTYMSRRVLKQSTMPIVIVCSDASLVQDSGISECCLRIEVPNQPTQQVADNLQRIASAESLSASPESWLALAEACGGDLRRAVNSMQLLGAPSEVHELLDTVATPQAACSRLLARDAESAPLSMRDRLALLSIDEQMLPVMVQENYLRACCMEEPSKLVSDELDESKVFHNLENCAVAADTLAWGDILGCAATIGAGDVELSNSALMMSAALPSALMAQCQLPIVNSVDGTPVASPALRCSLPEVSHSGPHPLHWSAVNELTRQFGLPRERVCAELLRWKRTVGKTKQEPRKAPRDMTANLKRYTSALQMASSSAAEAALRESNEAGICSGSIYHVESLRSPGYYLDDGGVRVIRITHGTPSEGNWAQFKFVLRSDEICNVESIRSPGYFLDDGGDGAIRLTPSTPTDDDTWAQFKLHLKGADVFSLESIRSPGYFLDDGGDGIVRLTHSSPGADDLWGQFKLALYQKNQADIEDNVQNADMKVEAQVDGEDKVDDCDQKVEAQVDSEDKVNDVEQKIETQVDSEDKVNDVEMKSEEQAANS